MDLLWEVLLERVPENIEQLYLLLEEHNQQVRSLASSHGFQEKNIQLIFTCKKHLFQKANARGVMQHIHKMIDLHDHLFNEAYFCWNEIVRRQDEHAVVFIHVNDEQVLDGYIFVKAELEFGEDSVEFFGVDRAARGKGIGTRL